jgi:repressor LexA
MGTTILPPKQKKIYEFINRFISENNYPPTFQEIADKFKIIIGTVQDHIAALIRKGYLERIPEKARGFRVINPDEDEEASRIRSGVDAIPLYGSVTAGEPIFADNNIQGYIATERPRRSTKELFALRVKGQSMKDAGIFEDDMVIVRKQSSASNGDIIIALLEDEATVKTLRIKYGKPYLEPANPAYKPIYSPFKVLGKVVELRRKYMVM